MVLTSVLTSALETDFPSWSNGFSKALGFSDAPGAGVGVGRWPRSFSGWEEPQPVDDCATYLLAGVLMWRIPRREAMSLHRFTPLVALIPAICTAWYFGDNDPLRITICGVGMYVILVGRWVKHNRRESDMRSDLDRLQVEVVPIQGHELVFHWERWLSGVRNWRKFPGERSAYVLGNTLILGPLRWATHLHPLQSTRTPILKHAVNAHVMGAREKDQTVIIEARFPPLRSLSRIAHMYDAEAVPSKKTVITIHIDDAEQRARLVRMLSTPVPV